jgi:predicted ATPase/class 3 adenylate cyclase
MNELPTGLVTFLFTDVEGSTRLWESEPEAMRSALALHDALLERSIAAHAGVVVKSRGEGDSFFAVFARASDAVRAAITIQRSLVGEGWPTSGPLRVRIALHTGDSELRDGDYYGPAVNRCARLRAAAHGGQILLSRPTYELTRDASDLGAEFVSLGEFRLKDIVRSEHIYQLNASGLPIEFPPLRTLDARPNNLPAARGPLIGRDMELAEVLGLIRRDDVRLVTLTGPGGTGKTSLGLRVATDAIDDFRDGAYFVSLASVDEPDQVALAIALALGLDPGNRSALDSLRDYCRDKRLLLLLDNFEQVLSAASLVSELLEASQGLRVLATSRSALRIRGEREFAVPPLACPDPNQRESAVGMAQYAAVSLFIERAVAIQPEFSVTNDNAPAVAEICARLDGLPLAIELAAARIRLLSPSAMLARLDRSLPLLTGGARDLPVRHQTLRATIAWSYELLDDDERTVFRRLGVFAGGFTLESAEFVCGPDGASGLVSVLDVIESLLTKSLVRQVAGVGGEYRFRMLETIREFALEQLREAGEVERIRRQHAEHFLDLAEQADAQLMGRGQLEWMRRLEADYGNVRAALEWSLSDAPEPDTSARLGSAMFWYWYCRSQWLEMRAWLGRGLDRLDRSQRSAVRARLLSRLGVAEFQQGRLADASTCLDDSVAEARAVGAMADEAFANFALGIVGLAMGDPDAAERRFDASLAEYRRLGERWSTALALMGLGQVALARGDIEGGRSRLEECLDIVRREHDTFGSAQMLNALGDIARRQIDYDRAGECYEESLAHFRSLGTRGPTAGLLHNLGYVALQRQDCVGAIALFVESLGLFRELGDRRGVAECLAGLAGVAAVEGSALRAAQLFGASAQALSSIGAAISPSNVDDHAAGLELVRARLGEAEFAAAMEAGRAMTTEAALALASGDGVAPCPTLSRSAASLSSTVAANSRGLISDDRVAEAYPWPNGPRRDRAGLRLDGTAGRPAGA